jgi:hypothetical protein
LREGAAELKDLIAPKSLLIETLLNRECSDRDTTQIAIRAFTALRVIHKNNLFGDADLNLPDDPEISPMYESHKSMLSDIREVAVNTSSRNEDLMKSLHQLSLVYQQFHRIVCI